jgi:predicted enzyme related to lactoylglutathione lyase
LLNESDVVIIVPIKDLDRAIEFYVESLGGSLNWRGEGDMKDSSASVNIGKTEFWLSKPEKLEERALAYTSFSVKNIKEIVNGLQKKGVNFEPAESMGPETKIEGPIAFTPYGAAAFFKDSEDNLLMVWENLSD